MMEKNENSQWFRFNVNYPLMNSKKNYPSNAIAIEGPETDDEVREFIPNDSLSGFDKADKVLPSNEVNANIGLFQKGDEIEATIEIRPPEVVNALGGDESALVWWSSVDIKHDINCWEIKRFRREKNHSKNSNEMKTDNHKWAYKGSTLITTQINSRQCAIRDLQNNYQYRFTVIARSKRDASKESSYSNTVFIDSVLPVGWIRNFDENEQKYYYSNIRSHHSSWTRPDDNPYFLSEMVIASFNRKEVSVLKDIFEEELHHFDRVSATRMRTILLEVGEDVSLSTLEKYFMKYSQDKTVIDNYQIYMTVLQVIKIRAERPKLPLSLLQTLLSTALRKLRLRMIRGKPLIYKEKKFGKWKEHWSVLAEKNYYCHEMTSEIRWDLPDDVRFYLPELLQTQLSQFCTSSQIHSLKEQFASMDSQRLGAITTNEMALLLHSLLRGNTLKSSSNQRTHTTTVRKDYLYRQYFQQTISSSSSSRRSSSNYHNNRNIEFDEFIYMVLTQLKAKRTTHTISSLLHRIGGGGSSSSSKPSQQSKVAIGSPTTALDATSTVSNGANRGNNNNDKLDIEKKIKEKKKILLKQKGKVKGDETEKSERSNKIYRRQATQQIKKSVTFSSSTRITPGFSTMSSFFSHILSMFTRNSENQNNNTTVGTSRSLPLKGALTLKQPKQIHVIQATTEAISGKPLSRSTGGNNNKTTQSRHLPSAQTKTQGQGQEEEEENEEVEDDEEEEEYHSSHCLCGCRPSLIHREWLKSKSLP